MGSGSGQRGRDTKAEGEAERRGNAKPSPMPRAGGQHSERKKLRSSNQALQAFSVRRSVGVPRGTDTALESSALCATVSCS